MLRRCALLRDNLTSKMNAAGRADELRKWSHAVAPMKPRGIPQIKRLDAAPIGIIHESKKVIVAGRSGCNGFNSNQYLVADKASGEAVLVDMADDWPDDWHAFIAESALTLKCIFFTHLHIDNIIGLPPFMHLAPETKLAWNYAEQYWVDKFPAACQRYGRGEMAHTFLPFRNLRLPNHILLSAGSNRTSSFLQIGDTLLFHMHTPGHSMGHMMLHVPQEKLLFSGDVVSHNGVGRVDLPQACGDLLAQSLRSLEDLPDNTVLLPGHGRLTTLLKERRGNRALQRVYELIAAGKAVPSVGFNNAGWM
jgi:glyoxylase-like metal-dependent hydrolase (beta-lactamase superfamily II)